MLKLSVIIISLLTSCALHIGYYKYSEIQQRKIVRSQFFSEQQELLRRISAQISPKVHIRDQEAIKNVLLAYEGSLFSMHLPVSLQVVIFDAPQQIIGIQGELAPYQSYYLQTLSDTQELMVSDTYVKSEMPDYPLFNYGIAIADANRQVLGVLEARMPLLAWSKYMEKHMYKFTQQALYTGITYLLFITLLSIIFVLVNRHIGQLRQEIKQLREHSETIAKYQEIVELKANVNILQVVADVYASVCILASDKGAKLHFPVMDGSAIYCYCKQKELLETLTTIVKNMLRQLGSNGMITLKIDDTQDHINFVFMDNGFYKELDESWGMLAKDVEFSHTLYKGNKVTYRMQHVFKNNIVRIEQYQDA